MAVVLHPIISFVVLFSLVINPCYCLNHKLFNVSEIQNVNDQWQMAIATWYGAPDGAGSDGGACGYGDSIEYPPLSKMISAGGPSIFLEGRGCGACYKVKCTQNSACSRNPVTVMITDSCPGCAPIQFDLSGTAFGSLANNGQAENLRNAGRINVQYQRVACAFGTSIAFAVDSGANPYYFATEIEYENGDGDIVDVALKQSRRWVPMQRSWGARWALNSGSPLQPPFTIKITENGNGRYNTIIAKNVIPRNWQPGKVYRSLVNF